MKRHWKKLVVAFAVLAGLYAGYRYTLHRRIEAKLNAIRAQGYPVTLAELDEWNVQPQSGQNAADFYLEAFKLLSRPKETENELPVVGDVQTPSRSETISAEMQQRIADYLSANQGSLQLLHQATSVRDCRYPFGVSQKERMGSYLHLFTRIRHCSRLLYLESLLSASKGNSQEATDAVEASIRLSRSLQDRPVLISYLVEEACLGLTIANLEQALSRTTFTDQQLADLGGAFEKASTSGDLAHALIGERAWARAEWENIQTGKVSIASIIFLDDTRNKVFDRVLSIFYRPTGLADWDYLSDLDLKQNLIDACKIDPPERLNRIASILQKAERLNALPITQSEAKIFRRTGNIDARYLAQLRAAQVSLAIERFRLANGALPDSLDQLCPKFIERVPADPFDGQPLRYRKLAKGYIVSSVGEKTTEAVANGFPLPTTTNVTFTVER